MNPVRFNLALISAFVSASLLAVEQWEVVDIDFEIDRVVKAPFEVEFGAVFRHEGGDARTIPGFYNGDSKWTLRFCPPEAGKWTYRTFSLTGALAGREGSLSVTPNTRDWQRGPIAISESNPQRFVYADGSPYFCMAFELDWLFALDAENPNDIPRTRKIVAEVADHGFNQIVMNVFAYDANWGERDKIEPEHDFAEPTVFPFGGDNTDPDYSTLDIAFFQRLDRVMAHLNEKQIASHLMIYVWNKKVNWPEPDSVEDNRYFDYVVKRYQAYPNLIWDISKEALAYGRDDMGYITRRIERLRKLDGHGRLLTVHDYNYCNQFPDKVDFISIQEWQPYLYYRMVEVRKAHPGEPIFNIEHGAYEKTTYSIFDGAYNDPVTTLDRSYQCVFAATYQTYYWQNASWYNVIWDPFSLPQAQQPHFRYYKYMTELFAKYPLHDLRAVQNAFSPPILTDGDGTYLFYLSEDRIGILGDLPGSRGKTYSIEWFDPMTGKMHDGGSRDFGTGVWLGINRHEDISGPLAIAILKETK